MANIVYVKQNANVIMLTWKKNVENSVTSFVNDFILSITMPIINHKCIKHERERDKENERERKEKMNEESV